MLISLRTFIVDDAVHNLDYLLRLREPERLLPQTGALVADDEDVVMIVLVFDKLSQLLQNKLDVLFAAGQEIPAGTSVKLLRKRFQLRGRVDCRVDADRNDARVFTEPIAECFLDLFEIACHRQTTTLTRGEERVDDDGLAL